MKDAMIRKLDKLSLFIGRIIIYPTALAVLIGALYVPTYAYMHKDDHQMVVHWKNAPPGGVNKIDNFLNRTDFEMSKVESEEFMKFVNLSNPDDTIVINGLRFKRSNVGSARYFDKSKFPTDVFETCKRFALQAKSYAHKIITLK